MDMGSSYAVFETTLNYKSDPYVQCEGPFNKANTDSSSDS